MEHHQLWDGSLVANFDASIHRSDDGDDTECTGDVEDAEQHVLRAGNVIMMVKVQGKVKALKQEKKIVQEYDSDCSSRGQI